MARTNRLMLLLLQFIPLLCLILPTLQSVEDGSQIKLLYAARDADEPSQYARVITSAEDFHRFKRSVPSAGGTAASTATASAVATAAAASSAESTTITSQPKPSITPQSFAATDSMQNAQNIKTVVRTPTDRPSIVAVIYLESIFVFV